MSKVKEYKFEIILFFIEAICMILELIASRVLSPYFGNSNIVWTSVIGIILLSSSLGNYIGGKIADKKGDLIKKLKNIIITAGVFVLLIPILNRFVLSTIQNMNLDLRIGAVISTIILFFIPNLFLGFLIPIVLKLRLTSVEETGNTSGRIYAISTLGGIVGTFFGGFVLIPNFGSIQILLTLPIVLFILAFMIDFKFSFPKDLIQVICILFIVLYLAIYSNLNFMSGKRVLNGDIGAYVSYDTEYSRVLIKNIKYMNEDVRLMNVGIGYESATYIDESRKYELVFQYLKYYDLMFKSKNKITDCLMIGGAGYGYPKYFISSYDNTKMDIVEIDGQVTELAKKYFYLDDLINEYNTQGNQRINIITEDGRTYLNRNTKKYDAILNDAFSGETPAKTLTTIENVQRIKESLRDDGLYLSNVIGAREGLNSRFLKAEVNTIRQVFKNVYVIPVNEIDNTSKANYMVIATDQDIDYEGCINLSIDSNEIVLTDDYAPIDTLIPMEKNQ